MKYNIILFVSLFFFIPFNAKSQAYMQGDITAFPNINAFHDSTNCMSLATESYMFTINNSFLGDSIIVKDQINGNIIAFEVNTSGANPWNTFINTMSLIPIVQDNQITGGFAAFFPMFQMKFICGPDTIYNVNSFYQLPVPNPCTYGHVSGRIYIDNNADCIYNSGDVALQSIPAQSNVNLTTGTQTYNGYSNGTGLYDMELQASWMNNYTVSIPSNYQFIFPATTCSPGSYTYSTLPQSNVDFSLQCSSQIDVQASLGSPMNVRPAIPFILGAFVSNTGCDTASGTLTLIKDPHAIYNAALSSVPATYVSGDTLKWNYANLSNLSSGAYWNHFIAGVHLTPDLTVNIGDTLCFSISSTILSNDINVANNQYSICLPVVNSYDPNAKEVSPKGTGATGLIPVNTKELDYTIHFQNTGTAVAYNISIIDTLDADIDPKTLQIHASSHTMSAQWLTPNVVKFIFSNIMLPDSNSNEPRSHGQVSFGVKLKTGLTIGTQIKNTAHIYFDTNPAIVTNTTLNTLGNPVSIASVNMYDSHLQIYPNPSSDKLFIHNSDTQHPLQSIEIYSLNMQLLQHVHEITNTTSIAVKDLSAGIYLLKIKKDNQYIIRKFAKE